MPTAQQYAIDGRVLTRDETRGVFGQVMGLVALTVGFTGLGAYIGRNLTGGTALILFVGACACLTPPPPCRLPRGSSSTSSTSSCSCCGSSAAAAASQRGAGRSSWRPATACPAPRKGPMLRTLRPIPATLAHRCRAPLAGPS